MTQEDKRYLQDKLCHERDKELLLKDLCSRLPYGVIILTDNDKEFDGGSVGVLTKIEPYIGSNIKYKGEYLLYQHHSLTPSFVDEVRPYLFPLSSMTEEQKIELEGILIELSLKAISDEIGSEIVASYEIDFYNKNHFDYRSLIPKGLAIDATGLGIY